MGSESVMTASKGLKLDAKAMQFIQQNELEIARTLREMTHSAPKVLPQGIPAGIVAVENGKQTDLLYQSEDGSKVVYCPNAHLHAREGGFVGVAYDHPVVYAAGSAQGKKYAQVLQDAYK